MENTENAVRPGQVWADNDARAKGRTVRVEELTVTNYGIAHPGMRPRFARCTILTDREGCRRTQVGKVTYIQLGRFRPHTSGYRLLSSPDQEPEG